MSQAVTVRYDQSKFDKTFVEYMKHTSRDLVTAINTKAYYIARKATWFTHKANKGQIRTALGQRITVAHTTKSGRVVNRKQLQLAHARDHDAPLAGLIINKRRGKKGEKGLHGKAMAVAIRDLLVARERSVAYTKSGWLPAIKQLALVADNKNPPSIDTTAKTVGRAKGDAFPARDLHSKSAATIINEAWAKRDSGASAFFKYGSQGLQKAFSDETASMKTYIEGKMNPAADKFNAAQK